MTRSARRRWAAEIDSEIDGLALTTSGPIFAHVYDPPAGGKWAEDVIPSKLLAFDRASGERLWAAPCEVGYGRGFGAGLGPDGNLLVVGPTQAGHRAVQVSAETGEQLGGVDVPEFDEALVDGKSVLIVALTSLTRLDSASLEAKWGLQAKDDRFHSSATDGKTLFVAVSTKRNRSQGLRAYTVARGGKAGDILAQGQSTILGLGAEDGLVTVLVEDLASALPEDLSRDYQLAKLMAEDGDDFGGGSLGGGEGGSAGVVAFAWDATEKRAEAKWFLDLSSTGLEDDPGEASIRVDSGKLYVARGAMISVYDLLSGRPLGEAAVPGLDDFVAWDVADGALLVAEETRLSVYELPD
ncbi:MAG: outer membrane protein assembly factor BamB family protein [Planctomycetota bacterium]|jgi:hypothetical protein